MSATITLNVVTKDQKALDYLNQLSQKKSELEKPITVKLDVNNIKQAADYTDKLASAWSRITSTVARRAINETYTAIRNSFRDALSSMKEVDTQLTNIQKVSGKTAAEINKIGDAAYDTASKYGVAADKYLSAVYTFQKAGLGDSAEKLGELATKTMLVGDTTEAVASKFLIAADAAWNYKGSYERLSEAVDKADWINNNYATTLDKIAAGMPVVAATAANMNMTLDETMAVLGTITSITQETGTKAATAWRALSMNLAKEVGTITDETGESIQVTEESIKSVTDALRLYGGEAIQAALDTGKVIKPIEAVTALAEAYKNGLLTDIELTNILMSVGGKLRTNQLTALVKDIAKGEGKNGSIYLKMLSELPKAAGTADSEISIMLESWESKTKILQNTWTKFIANLVSRDEIKGLIDDVTGFVDSLDPEKIGSALKDGLYPIIDFIKTKDWAGAAQNISKIFDKIVKWTGGAIILSFLKNAFDVLSGIVGLLSSIGSFLGVGTVLGAEGATAAGVASAAGAGGGLIGGLLLLMGTIGNIAGPAVQAQREIKSLTEESKKLEAITKDTSGTYKNQIDTLSASRTVLGLYVDKLDGLTEGTDEYNNVLEAMVQLMPELSSIIDTTTGHIDGGTDAILDYADSWYKAAEAAVYQAMYTEIATEKIQAELERTKNQNSLNAILAEHPEIAVYKELLAEKQKMDEKLFSGFVLSAAESEAYNKLVDQIKAIEEVSGAKAALAEVTRLQAAIDLQTKRIDDAQDKLDDLTENYGAKENPKNPEEEERDYQEKLNKRAEARRRQFAATQDATQAENDYAEAAAESGQTGAQAATITAKAIDEKTVPALQEVKKALDEIPVERSITLTPHFDDALEKIQQYITFLSYLKQNYTSVLTSSVRHYDPEHGVDTTSYVSSGASAAGGITDGGPTLVNELGPELISENGRAYIAGGGKPTVVNLSRGAIVIPADQTREALKGGMPKYGRAGVFVGNFTNQGGNPSIGGVAIPTAAKPTIKVKTTSGNKGKSSGTSSSGTTITFDFKSLESALSNTLKLYDAQAKLAENEGDYAKMAEMYEKSQEAIKDLVDKYRQAGYADDSIEIVTLLNKNYDYAKKQLDLYEDKWDDLIKALEADTDATKALKDLEEKRVALEEAVTAYEKAQKQRTVRMYNAATGQWEWIADEKQVQSAKEKVTSAEETYNDAVKKQAIEELKKMKDSVTDLSDIVLGPALSAVVTMSETSDEFQAFARALDAVFGVGSFLQSTEGTTKALSTVDSHDTNYSFGGVSLTEEQAASMTLKELAQMLQVLKLT